MCGPASSATPNEACHVSGRSSVCLHVRADDHQEATPLDLIEWRRLYPRLRRFAAVVGDSDMEPDDLVQDALASVLARGGVLDRPEAYLRAAIVRHATDRRRRAARWRLRVPRVAVAAVTWDRYPSDDELLDDLGPLDRAVLHLSIVDGIPLVEIAEQLGVTEAAVRQRAHRARRRARSTLRDQPASLGEAPS